MNARSLALPLLLIAAACSSSSSDGNAPGPVVENPPPGVVPPPPPGPPPCSGKPGTFHDQPFDSGGETRHFWLHVPDSYKCETGAAIIVDFHGTGYGTATDTVEESWATPELLSASDDLGFIVVRPRSRMKAAEAAGYFTYQWNINPGDVAKNRAFALELLSDLKSKYHVDDARIYATGFSNGPGMATQFLGDGGDTPSPFKGYGLMAGGADNPPKRTAAFDASAPRIYTMTGFRDYMLIGTDELDAYLRSHQYPADHRFNREADTGHEVYGWHFREAFAWMDAGTRPPPGAVAAPWISETTGTTESFIELTQNPAGKLVGVGAKGGVYTRSDAGVWTNVTTLSTIAPISDICFLPSGKGFAVGHGHAMTTSDGVAWTELVIPELSSVQSFGYTYATTIACDGTRVTAGGLWAAATSNDGGATWDVAHLEQAQSPAFLTAIRPTGTSWLGVGYFYAGFSSNGVDFTDSTPDAETQWWNDAFLATSTHGAIVGEGGHVDLTDDGGQTFTPAPSPTKEDLYVVQMRGLRGVAAGAHGAVILTTDGGATWTSRPTGLDGFVGGARFLDDTTFVVAGERGQVLRSTF